MKETANDRFRKVRKICGKTQEEWGAIIGITKNGVCDIETGRRNVTDKHLVALDNYKEKPVNTNYIKTGKGGPLLILSKSAEIAALTEKLFKDEKESFRSRLILALSKLQPEEWEVLEKLAIEITKKD